MSYGMFTATKYNKYIECKAGHTIMYICPKIWAFFLRTGLELDRAGRFGSGSSIKRVNFGTMGREF